MARHGAIWLRGAGAALAIGLCVPASHAQAPAGHGASAVANAAATAQELPLNTRFLLVDHNGRPVTDEFFRDRYMLIAFGFVSCPDVCPTTLSEMAAVLAKLGDRAGRLQALFITVDPERDTREVLREYTRAFDARILGLTGSQEMVSKAAEHYRVRYEKIREPGAPPGAYTMDHTAGMFLVGPGGEFLAKLAYGTPVDALAGRITEFLDQPRSAVRR